MPDDHAVSIQKWSFLASHSPDNDSTGDWPAHRARSEPSSFVQVSDQRQVTSRESRCRALCKPLANSDMRGRTSVSLRSPAFQTHSTQHDVAEAASKSVSTTHDHRRFKVSDACVAACNNLASRGGKGRRARRCLSALTYRLVEACDRVRRVCDTGLIVHVRGRSGRASESRDPARAPQPSICALPEERVVARLLHRVTSLWSTPALT